jgi:hypothetical protein
MNAQQPPAMATWLIERLGNATTREAIVGDLIEQYRQGRPGLWYWRQVLGAIVREIARDAGSHKLLMLRAMALYFLVMSLSAKVVRLAYSSLGIWMWNWTIDYGFDSLRVWWFGRPEFPDPPRLLMACVSSALAGWLVARSHRPHAPAMVCGCAIGVWILAVTQEFSVKGTPGLLGFWVLGLPGPMLRMGMHAPANAVYLAGVPLGVVLGGLLALQPALHKVAEADSP